jgi:hypothetical protein
MHAAAGDSRHTYSRILNFRDHVAAAFRPSR